MLLQEIAGALVVECVVAIENEETHAGHFWIRDQSSDGVRPSTSLDRIGDIRYLQDFIVEQAQVEGVPVIENSDREVHRRRDGARARCRRACAEGARDRRRSQA